MRQRIEWCNLLNEKIYFNYKFNNKYKLTPIIYNIFIFFETYFPSFPKSLFLENREKTTQHKLNHLLKILDVDKTISIKYFITGNLTSDKIYEENLIKIFINENNIYDWQLYQYYENLNNSKGKIITGFSELKYSYYLNKYT
jgi:hypothetical protein